jgi:hypothetical protein
MFLHLAVSADWSDEGFDRMRDSGPRVVFRCSDGDTWDTLTGRAYWDGLGWAVPCSCGAIWCLPAGV